MNGSPANTCPACGGPPIAVSACVARPGALPIAEIYDGAIFAGRLAELDDLPTTCPGCHVDADQAHHIGCELDACDEHDGLRAECSCDAEWLAAQTRASRPRWPRLHLPRPRWPKFRRRTFRYGETITRVIPDAATAPPNDGRNPR